MLTGTVMTVLPLLTRMPPKYVPALVGAVSVATIPREAPFLSENDFDAIFILLHVALCRNSTLRLTCWGPVGIIVPRGKIATVQGEPAVITGRWPLGPSSATWHRERCP
jgi:hypothetical protein